MLVSPLGRHFESLRPRQRSKSNVIGIVQRLVLGPGSFARHLSFFFSFFVCLVSHLECLGPIFGGLPIARFPFDFFDSFSYISPLGKTKKCYSPNSLKEFLGLGLATSVVMDQLLALTHTHTHWGLKTFRLRKRQKQKQLGGHFSFWEIVVHLT